MIPFCLKTSFPFSFADHVSVSDEVLVEENNGLTTAKVIKVSTLIEKGDCSLFKIHFDN